MSEETLTYFQRLQKIKLNQLPKEAVAKKKVPLKKISSKRMEENKVKKESGGDDEMDLFFKSLRKGMKNKCLFCGGATMKNDDEKFHFSLAHLLPKAIFKSIATNPDNIIELCFFGESCHTNFDSGKISWLMIKDSKEWLQIKEQLLAVLPMVSENEKKNKLYDKICKLVYSK